MRHSDKQITIGLNSAIVLLGLAAIIGCMRPKTYSPNDPGLGEGSFTVDKVSLAENKDKEEKAEIVALHEGFSIPSRKRFYLKACLKTNKIETPVARGAFLLTGKDFDGKEIQPQTLATDEKGCLSWKEEISYNFFADEVYVPLTRVLTALNGGGGQRGSRTLKLALNPWNLSGSAAEVLDLNQKDAVPKGVQVKEAKDAALYLTGGKTDGPAAGPGLVPPGGKASDGRSKQLSLGRFSLISLPAAAASSADQQGRVLQLILHEVAVNGRDAQKKQVKVPLTQALLEIDHATLVAVINGQRYRVQEISSKIPLTANEQGFMASIPFTFQPVEEQRTSYELLLRVRTKGFEGLLRPFEALLSLGSHAVLMSSHTLLVNLDASNVSNPNFSIQQVQVIQSLPPVGNKPGAEPKVPTPTEQQAPPPVASQPPVNPQPAPSPGSAAPSLSAPAPSPSSQWQLPQE